MVSYEQLEKEEKIKKEINRIKKLYKDFPKDKVKALEGLIQEVAFLKVSLQELREDLTILGLVEWFEQGEQRIKRERPECKIYSTFTQRYSQIMKQLIDLLPSEEKKGEKNKLQEFIMKGKINK